MVFKKRTIHLTIRYLDDSTDDPETVKKTIEVSPYTDPNVLKRELYKICNIANEKVMKIRNEEGALVPISFIADPNIPDSVEHMKAAVRLVVEENMPIRRAAELQGVACVTLFRYFQLDITNVSYIDRPAASLLQDAYVDAVQQKIRTLECRIAQSELLLPQLEWRRQAYMEDTVNGLLYKVGFLNRRFDELLPQCRPKQPETMS